MLKKLRTQLTAPQPRPKTVRRPWRHVTDLQPGDILSFTSESGVMMLLRVARIDDHRVGAAPILLRFEDAGKRIRTSSSRRPAVDELHDTVGERAGVV